MGQMRRALLLLAMLAVAIPYAAALETEGAIRYVSSSIGNDAWDGISPIVDGTHGPKATVAAAEALLNASNSGDKVLFRRGDSWTISSGFHLDYRASGAAGLPVTVGAYGSGARPIIASNLTDGSPVIAVRGGSTTETAHHIVFDGLQISNTNANTAERGLGVFIVEGYAPFQAPGFPHHITFTNMFFAHLRLGLQNAQGSYVTIQDSFFDDTLRVVAGNQNVSDDAVFSDADYFTIINTTFTRGGTPTNFFSHTLYLGGDNMLIAGNVFHDN